MTKNIIENKIIELENRFGKDMFTINRLNNCTILSIFKNIKNVKRVYNNETNNIERLELILSSTKDENYLDNSQIFYKIENEKVFESKQGFVIILD